LFIFADAHQGAGGRNKVLYNSILAGFKHIINTMDDIDRKMMVSRSMRFNLADLWDSNMPSPMEYIHVHSALVKENCSNIVEYYGIPGNHDKINLNGNFAWEIMCLSSLHNENYKFYAFDKPSEVMLPNGKIVLMLPFIPDMFEQLANYKGNATILFGHFSTFQSHHFAGMIDERDEVFKRFELVIHGDTHECYDSGKFHTTGSMGCFKIDEMIGKKCIPSILYMDENSPNMVNTLKRITFPEFKPTIIEKEEDAVDETKIYIMISDTPSTKANIIVKAPDLENLEESDSAEIQQLSTSNVTIASLIEATFPELEKEKREKLRRFCERNIDVDELVSEKHETIQTLTEMVVETNIYDLPVVPQQKPKEVVSIEDLF